jgi:2,6-dihydroxypyridine 3-monooxygenase
MASLRILVVGGSLGGLTAALTLRDLGHDVTIYERAATPLAGLGAGIVLNPLTVRYLVERSGIDLTTISIASNWVRYLAADGSIAHERQTSYRFSSYNALYRGLLDQLPSERYCLATPIVGHTQQPNMITAEFADGSHQQADLLVWAVGIRSTGRRLICPNAQLEYAGYVAWRGTVGADELGSAANRFADAITYYVLPQGHMLVYPIPVVDRAGASGTQLNWLWYQNVAAGAALNTLLTDASGVQRDVSVPAGMVNATARDTLHDDASQLPLPLAELVRNTAQPFIQAIMDLEPAHMVDGRACIMGDAAFVARPHAAAGTAKAAADAWALSAALAAHPTNVAAALAQWETQQIALGRNIVARTRAAGERVQFQGTWEVGAALPFGLFAPGDSIMA